MNWNLNVQREITPSLSAMVGYVGSHTLHMPYTTDDRNMVVTKLTPGIGYLWPFPAGSGTKANPNVGVLRPTFWADTASSDSPQRQFIKMLGQGSQANGCSP